MTVHKDPNEQPFGDEPAAELYDWQLDQERRIIELRTQLTEQLDNAEDALYRAAQQCADLIELYDVEIAEGPGIASLEVLGQMRITLAGVRATTADAGWTP